VHGLTAELAASASYPFKADAGSAVDGQFDVDEGSFEQVSQILTDMAGEQFSGYAYHPDSDMLTTTTTYPNSRHDALCNGTREYQPLGGIDFTDTQGLDLSSYAEEFSASYGRWSCGTSLERAC